MINLYIHVHVCRLNAQSYYYIVIITCSLLVIHILGSTIRCAQCHSCAAGHGTGMETCDGQTCFVKKLKFTSSNASVVDRGCFSIQHESFATTINRLCSGDTFRQGNFLTVYTCCNNTELCNTNLTVHFRPNRTPSPTTALSPAATVPVGEEHVCTGIVLAYSTYSVCVCLMRQTVSLA